MWKHKVAIQCILAHIPYGEHLNHALQRVSGSWGAQQAKSRLVPRARSITSVSEHIKLEGATVVEVGPGWDLIGSILLHLLGAKTIYAYDHVPHARLSLVGYLLQGARLGLRELSELTGVGQDLLEKRVGALEGASTLEELMERAGIIYCAPADACRTGLGKQSVDLFFSYAVLEHVPPQIVDDLTREARRVLRSDGVLFHVISMGDHYNQADSRLSSVNFLKYPEWLWNLLVQNRISYHNRMRECEFLGIFSRHEGQILRQRSSVDSKALKALQTMRVCRRFANMTPEQLAVERTEIAMRFPPGMPEPSHQPVRSLRQ